MRTPAKSSRWLFWYFGIFICTTPAFGAVVINEIHYNPPDLDLESGVFREFIELYNSSGEAVDVGGYYFDSGIDYAIPAGTRIEANSFLVIVKNTSPRYWSNKPFRIIGPYPSRLADGGERLRLRNQQGEIVDTVTYDDRPPWPLGADGYGSSLERIAWDLPPGDYHTWRASLTDGGTPGAVNSVAGTPDRPAIVAQSFTPSHPSSGDTVQVRVTLDSPHPIDSVTLRYERVGAETNDSAIVRSDERWRYWKGTFAPSAGLEWTQIEFNDRSWETGLGGFGYGDLGPVSTELNDMRGAYSTFYIRKSFYLSEDDLDKPYRLNIYYDDGFICYLNGVEAARAQAPQTYTNESVSSGSHESDEPELFTLSTEGVLQSGENVIALVGFNVSLGNSSDFVLAPSLLSADDGVWPHELPMTLTSEDEVTATFQAEIPPQPTQSLIRTNIKVKRVQGDEILLPHSAEPAPFYSYFVYDGEVEASLPLLWLFETQRSPLIGGSAQYSAAVSLSADDGAPIVYDGAIVLPSASQRLKVRFLKGSEFYGDRTINVIPEIPTGGTNAGISSPYREHLGFWLFEQMGVLTPWSRFYRVIEMPAGTQTQRLINEQVNENFLAMNGRDPDADLYKLVYSNPNWEKHTNKDEGTGSIESLLSNIRSNDLTQRRRTIEENIEVDEFLNYSAASMFVSNWDGYWNNNWMYLDPDSGRWEIIPWDLDWVWGAVPPPNQDIIYARMPLSFPIDGVAIGEDRVSRAPGPVTSPMHRDGMFYEAYVMRMANRIDREFSEETMFSKIDEMKAMLFDDLDKIAAQTGRNVSTRKTQIESSYAIISDYIQERRAYLKSVLPADVNDWSLFEW
ncbi:MAG: hypothetical protein GC154_17510 [bacterium]|nr:hypothetical protein [bacterium]